MGFAAAVRRRGNCGYVTTNGSLPSPDNNNSLI
jgi:hypothetical protein